MATTAPDLFAPLTLPNGQVIPNRIAKAAMEESLADRDQLPGEALRRLYARWAEGGAGLIISGNVMVDPTALTGPGGVVLDEHQPLAPFVAWAQAARSGGGQAWLQINHPGRQVPSDLGQPTVAPSAVALNMGGFSKMFALPRALGPEEIEAIVARFATTAALAEKAGFNGVEVHAAHGYLLSQFLSPLTNVRIDQWGGSLENRARLLLDVVRAIRARVEPSFCIAVKLNSADFQKGGFEPADAAAVVSWLGELGVDLVELSGGSYERPAMQGSEKPASTKRREAYFIEFAREIGAVAPMPIMVTGGISDLETARRALASENGRAGVAMVGIATAMAYVPDLPSHWREGRSSSVALPALAWKNRLLASFAGMAMTGGQLARLASGRKPRRRPSAVLALVCGQIKSKPQIKRYRAWIADRGLPERRVIPDALTVDSDVIPLGQHL